MKLVVLSLAFVFSSFSLAAQNRDAQGFVVGITSPDGQTSAQQTMALRAMNVSSGCPVAMRLNQTVSGSLREAGKGQSGLTYAAKLHLVLSQVPHGKIVAASVKAALVTVHGYDGTPRFELISSGQNTPAVKMMKIRFVPVGLKGATADFLVVGFASASSLDIDSLTYADGSIWKPAQGETCTVAPNPFMLIGANYNSGAARP